MVTYTEYRILPDLVFYDTFITINHESYLFKVLMLNKHQHQNR